MSTKPRPRSWMDVLIKAGKDFDVPYVPYMPDGEYSVGRSIASID
ncbi:hypothetical protein [Xanthomonas albilineans]